MNQEIKKDIEILWEYLCLKREETKAECIIGLGSILECIPKKCAELYQKGLGDYILFSGNCGKGTEGVISKTEAEIFREIAIQEGVPKDKIFLEKEATNTYENFKYGIQVLEKENLHPQSFLIVGKPYQERRAKNIAGIELAKNSFSIASFSLTFSEFLEYVSKNNFMSLDDVINEMVAEINIGIIAPEYGIQQKEEIPKKVLESYDRLCRKGFTRYLITDDKIKYTMEKWKEKNLIR